jgi:hypothetical protein
MGDHFMVSPEGRDCKKPPVIFEKFYLKMAQGGRFFYGFMKFIFLVSVLQKLDP